MSSTISKVSWKYCVISFLIAFCTTSPLFSIAQTDTEFWFAAPEVSSNNSNFDKPIVFRFTAGNQSAIVTLSQPANPLFTPIIVNVASNSTTTVDVTQHINMIENGPADVVLNKGVHISSTSPITAYYEVVSSFCLCNPELFTLKGNNALGTLFFTPFQTNYNNEASYSPTPYSGFDIVATQNNTIVTITPTKNIVGHAANQPFSVNLNRGQTYSAIASSTLSSEHMTGSKVESNFPIAITIKDDLLRNVDFGDSGSDLMGDQLVPVNVLGTEYIIRKGALSIERAYIVATQNNTNIHLNGSSTPVTILQEGQSYTIQLASAATYVTANHAIYVLHLSGSGNEIGGAIMPSLACSGSSSISFTRSTPSALVVNIVVPSGGESNFQLNGNSSLVPASAFTSVPGTNGQWLSAQFSFSTFTVPVNSTNVFSNTSHVFHLGVLQGSGSAGGTSYGYFSNFNSVNVTLGADKFICSGDNIVLNAGNGFASYLWNTGATTSTIVVNTPGTYSVNVSNGACTGTDSINVVNDPVPLPPNLGSDITICSIGSVQLSANSNAPVFLWSNGATTPNITVNTPGVYWVEVQNQSGCSIQRDSVIIAFSTAPAVNLGNDTTICSGEIIILGAGVTGTWQNGSQSTGFQVSQPGLYWVEVTSNGCTTRDSVNVTISPMPNPQLGSDTTLCAGSTLVLNSNTSSGSVLWQDGSTASTFLVNSPGTYNVTVTNSSGCVGYDTIQVSFSNQISVSLGADTTICAGSSLALNAGAGFTSYLWSTGATTQTINVTTPGIYSVTISNGACQGTDQIQVSTDLIPSFPNLGADTTICASSNIVLSANTNAPVILWSTGATTQSITLASSGIYWVEVQNLSGCSIQRDSISLTVAPSFSVDLGNDTTLCSGTNLLIGSNLTGIWQDGSSSTGYMVTQQGTYWVDVSLNGCTVRDSVFITYQPKPLPDLGSDTTLCLGSTLLLSALTPSGTYLWQNGSTSATFLVSAPGIYSVSVFNTSGCIGSDSIKVLFDSPLDFTLGADTVVCNIQALTLNLPSVGTWQDGSVSSSYLVETSGKYWATISNGVCITTDTIEIDFLNESFAVLGADTQLCFGQEIILAPDLPMGVSILWEDGTSLNPRTVTQAGTYWIKVQKHGCVSIDSIQISEADCNLNIPNVISPNNDGINDYFSISTGKQKNVWDLKIFNRWGQMVLDVENYSNDWQGINNPAGVYYFVITQRSNSMSYKGWVEILK